MAKIKVDKAQEAANFEKIINRGRERKRDEALAASIFSKGRRLSAPSKVVGAAPSLASRVGVKKRVASTSARPAGNINGEWTHDLHQSSQAAAPTGALASRITAPGSKPPRAANKRAARLAGALQRADASTANIAPSQPRSFGKPPTQPKNFNARKQQQAQQNGAAKKEAGPAPAPEISIRGLAGPFSVLMQNLAPGTTAADIESAVTPVSGEMMVCRIVKTRPIMLAEMVFSSRDAGDLVIKTFDGKTADGRVIKVFPNPQGYQPESARPETRSPASRDHIVDGTMGFPEGVVDASPGAYAAGASGGLYSDSLVAKRGRGVRGDWSR
ncbi:uncharacterized protein DNG_03314 [Cephalotrichum gorgonifer]|uniref:RRM domain-containing protein n=1 Tax=Cephalotrichum gorgonifer TaxID=2041049 RepID=A0AAE8STV8_9PEZI|nr:uncharacterized protein DNG_03314 [Cephalotrichum gorgonifer]